MKRTLLLVQHIGHLGWSKGADVEAARCDRCRHWGQAEPNSGEEHRRCERVPCGEDAGSADAPDPRAYVRWYGEPTNLYTAEDFGCALFEAKP